MPLLFLPPQAPFSWQNNNFHDDFRAEAGTKPVWVFASPLEGCRLSDLWFALGANVP